MRAEPNHDAAIAALALVSGALFAVGLAVSGMTQQSKVLGFLDLGGDWDPSLMLVMGGAIPVHAIAWALLKRRGAPLLGGHLPDAPAKLNAKVPVGAALFGIGWGLAGVCPGPALVDATSLGGAFVFVPAMIAGVLLARLIAPMPVSNSAATA